MSKSFWEVPTEDIGMVSVPESLFDGVIAALCAALDELLDNKIKHTGKAAKADFISYYMALTPVATLVEEEYVTSDSLLDIIEDTLGFKEVTESFAAKLRLMSTGMFFAAKEGKFDEANTELKAVAEDGGFIRWAAKWCPGGKARMIQVVTEDARAQFPDKEITRGMIEEALNRNFLMANAKSDEERGDILREYLQRESLEPGEEDED